MKPFLKYFPLISCLYGLLLCSCYITKGKADLKIDLITACECTTLDWSRLPIKEGQRSNIKIRYNSKDKVGPQTVDLDIMANTATGFSYTKFKLIVIL